MILGAVLKSGLSIFAVLAFSACALGEVTTIVEKVEASDEFQKPEKPAVAGLDDLEKMVKEKEEKKADQDKTRQEEVQKDDKLNALKKAGFATDLAQFHRIFDSEQSTDEIRGLAWSALTRKWNIAVAPDGYRTNSLVWDDRTAAPILVEGKTVALSGGASRDGIYLLVGLDDGRTEELPDAPADLLTNDAYKTDKLIMRRIPAGEFMMGSPATEDGRASDELQHKVTLTKCFYIGVFEVTQEQWKVVMKSKPSLFKNAGKSAPVDNVSWDDCQEFIKKLNSKAGGSLFCLPTEAEWEYACRAGTATRLNSGKSESDMAATGWYCGNSGVSYEGGFDLSPCSWVKDKSNKNAGTHHVGIKAPNTWGLYDMHGNVLEWCSDWFGNYPSGAVTDPSGPASGSERVFRGGGWLDDAVGCRSANRNCGAPDGPGRHLGFRLARSAGQE